MERLMVKIAAIRQWLKAKLKANKKKVFGIGATLVVAVVAIIILVFCFNNKNEDEILVFKGSKANIEKTNERKKSLVIGTSEMVNTSETYLRANQATKIANALVYEPLIRINSDLTIENVLAESIEFSADGLEAEVTLREAVFSDGSVLTAEDVKAAYLEILKNGEDDTYVERCRNIKGVQEYTLGVFADVEGIIVNGERKFKIVFKRLAAWNMEAFTIPIFKEAQVDGESALGTGPYKIDNYQHNESMQLSANNNSKSTAFKYEQVVIKRFSTLGLSKDIDKYEVDAFIIPYNDSLDDIKKAGYHNVYRLIDTKNLNYFLFNFDDESGDNILIRKAISKSMDRERLSEEFEDGRVMNNGYLTATSEKAEMLSRDVKKAKSFLKKVSEPKISYYGEIDAISKIRFNGIKESLSEAGITVEEGDESEYTMTYVRSGDGMILSDIENSILNTRKKEEYYEKLKSVYKKSCNDWMELINEYYSEECLIIPYSTNTYHLVISSDVDTKAIREFIANNY